MALRERYNVHKRCINSIEDRREEMRTKNQGIETMDHSECILYCLVIKCMALSISLFLSSHIIPCITRNEGIHATDNRAEGIFLS